MHKYFNFVRSKIISIFVPLFIFRYITFRYTLQFLFCQLWYVVYLYIETLFSGIIFISFVQSQSEFVTVMTVEGTQCGENITLIYTGSFIADIEVRCVTESPVMELLYSETKNLSLRLSYGLFKQFSIRILVSNHFSALSLTQQYVLKIIMKTANMPVYGNIAW